MTGIEEEEGMGVAAEDGGIVAVICVTLVVLAAFALIYVAATQHHADARPAQPCVQAVPS